VRWARGDGRRIGLSGRRCAHRGVRRWAGWSTASGSGRRLRAGCRARMLRLGRAGVSAAVGVRWFREGGGMSTVTLAAPSGRYLSFAEREEIAILRAGGARVREIARQLGRSPSTISREPRCNAATRCGGFAYRATTAQWHADLRARRPKPAKLAVNTELRRYVQDRLWGRCSVLVAAPLLARRSDGSAGVMAAHRPALGAVVEPGADLKPAAPGLSR
jgi:hypothetical protein